MKRIHLTHSSNGSRLPHISAPRICPFVLVCVELLKNRRQYEILNYVSSYIDSTGISHNVCKLLVNSFLVQIMELKKLDKYKVLRLARPRGNPDGSQRQVFSNCASRHFIARSVFKDNPSRFLVEERLS